MNDLISRKWLMECVNEGWIKFDTEKDENRFIHLVRDIAPSAQPDSKELSFTHKALDTISRQAAIDAIDRERKKKHLFNTAEDGLLEARGVINTLPSAPLYTEAEIQTMQDLEWSQMEKMYELGKSERKKGKWNGYKSDNSEWQRDDGSPIFLICSECKEIVLNNGSAHWNFCPNCGADMREGEKE